MYVCCECVSVARELGGGLCVTRPRGAGSYTWKRLGSKSEGMINMDMGLTLEENGVIDESDEVGFAADRMCFGICVRLSGSGFRLGSPVLTERGCAQFESMSLDDSMYVSAVYLYFNDDLTSA